MKKTEKDITADLAFESFKDKLKDLTDRGLLDTAEKRREEERKYRKKDRFVK